MTKGVTMPRKLEKFTSQTKFLGIPLFTITQTSYEILTESDTPSVTEEVILQERINLLREKEKRKKRWFK